MIHNYYICLKCVIFLVEARDHDDMVVIEDAHKREARDETEDFKSVSITDSYK